MSRFVPPDSDRLPLSNGDWVLVKRRLNAGETHDRLARMSEQVQTADGWELRIKMLEAPMATVTAYLLDWSLTDEQGRVIPIAGLETAVLEETLRNLDPDDFSEIRQAIDTHVAAVKASRDEAKKKTAGENAS